MPARDSIFDKKPEDINKLKKESSKFFVAWYDFVAISLRREILKKPFEFLWIFAGTLLVTILIVFLLLSLLFNRINISFSTPTFFMSSMPSIELFSGNSTTSRMDPIDLLNLIKENNKDYALIDVRSAKEFNEGHIKTAVSVPVYNTNLIDKNGKLNMGEIKSQINNLTKGKKMIVVYGRTQFSNYPSQIAAKLGKKGQALGVGWNEFAHFKTLWVPESMWDTVDIQNYIQTKE